MPSAILLDEKKPKINFILICLVIVRNKNNEIRIVFESSDFE